MRNILRLSTVFVIGVVAFLLAVNKLNRPPFSSCQQDARPDPSYQITIDERPSILITQYHLNVKRNDVPIDRDPVCIRADMGGAGNMSGMGITREAVPLGKGRYEVSVVFAMGGPWRGAVLIQPKGGSGNVEVPLQIDVAAE